VLIGATRIRDAGSSRVRPKGRDRRLAVCILRSHQLRVKRLMSMASHFANKIERDTQLIQQLA
jgi:hypothetical protein